MLTTTAALAAHLKRRATSMTTLWWVRRTDGRVFGFTSLDVDVVFEGVRYEAESGILPSAVSTRSGLQVDNSEAQGFLASQALTESDIIAGVWDHAEIRIFQINWQDLVQGRLRLRRGWLGEVTLKDNRFVVEVRGLTAALNAVIGELVTPSCAAELGDTRCGIDLTDYTAIAEVTSVSAGSRRIFDTDLPGATVRLTPSTTGNPDANYFADGKLTWLTGANAGLSEDVRTYATNGELALQLPMTRDIEVGDTFTVHAGCSKARDGTRGCIDRFDNIVNFRGFPDLPGLDKLLRTGGQ